MKLKTIEKINETKSYFFGKISKTDKSPANWQKNKKQKNTNCPDGNTTEDISTNSALIKMMIRKSVNNSTQVTLTTETKWVDSSKNTYFTQCENKSVNSLIMINKFAFEILNIQKGNP